MSCSTYPEPKQSYLHPPFIPNSSQTITESHQPGKHTIKLPISSSQKPDVSPYDVSYTTYFTSSLISPLEITWVHAYIMMLKLRCNRPLTFFLQYGTRSLGLHEPEELHALPCVYVQRILGTLYWLGVLPFYFDIAVLGAQCYSCGRRRS